jgi:hypothetical protein
MRRGKLNKKEGNRYSKWKKQEFANTPSLVKYTHDLLTLMMDEYVGWVVSRNCLDDVLAMSITSELTQVQTFCELLQLLFSFPPGKTV